MEEDVEFWKETQEIVGEQWELPFIEPLLKVSMLS